MLAQLLQRPSKGEALLDLYHTTWEELVGSLKLEGNLDDRDHKTLETMILWKGGKKVQVQNEHIRPKKKLNLICSIGGQDQCVGSLRKKMM